jgi:putative hydrolase of the HAD superfamily
MNQRADYEAILFDVGGTLVNVVRDPHVLAIEAIAHLGILSVSDFSAAIRKVVDDWRASDGQPEVEDLPDTWIEHNRRALKLAGFTGDLSTAAKIMEDVFLTDGLELFPDVMKVLVELSGRGLKLAVVSNWPATLEATLRGLGLQEYFPVIVASGTVGYAKPHPAIFRIAIDRLGVEPRQALYIGDSMEHDVAGAGAAGMDVLLLDREGHHKGHHTRLDSLLQLLDSPRVSKASREKR